MVKIIFSKVIPVIAMILTLISCAVVRTPYARTSYYQKTVSRLDSTGSGVACVNDSLFAGFAKISITPSLFNKVLNPEDGKFNKVPMAGFGQRNGKSATGVHDSLFVKAIAIREGMSTVILVSADILIMPPNIIDAVSELLHNDGLQRGQVFFSATHSHSSIGGWAYGLVGKQFAGKENKELEKWLIMKIHTAIKDAISDLKPARIGSGNFDAAMFTRNRLNGKDGIKNNDFNFIVVKQNKGRKSVIGSYSAHATTLGDKNLELSADYPGYWERRIENRTADLAMFCGGSMGSQSPVGPKDGFANAEYIGNTLADSLIFHIGQVEMNEKNVFSAYSLKINLPAYHFRMTKNINLSTGLSKRLMEMPKNVYIQGLRINNLVWIFTPGDFSGEYAVEIKNKMSNQGFDAMVTSFNGSYVGYIVPGKYFNMNNYETKLMGWFGPNMGDYIMDIIYKIINALIYCN